MLILAAFLFDQLCYSSRSVLDLLCRNGISATLPTLHNFILESLCVVEELLVGHGWSFLIFVNYGFFCWYLMVRKSDTCILIWVWPNRCLIHIGNINILVQNSSGLILNYWHAWIHLHTRLSFLIFLFFISSLLFF